MEQRSHYNIPQGTIDIEEVIVVKELPKDGPTKRNKSV
jgi:hypothetical protein